MNTLNKSMLTLLTAVLIATATQGVYGQGTDISGRKFPLFYVGANVTPSQMQIALQGEVSGTSLTAGRSIGLPVSLTLGCLLSSKLGVSLGAGYSTWFSKVEFANYEGFLNTIDSEDETYERRIYGSGYIEEQGISFLDIPLTFRLSFPLSNNKLGIFFNPGMMFSLPMTSTYSGAGTFTYKGYYPQYNVLLENLPQYGFPTEEAVEIDGILEMNPMILSLNVSAGIEIYVGRKLQVLTGFAYTSSLSDISGYTGEEVFILSTDPEEVNSLMEASTKTSLKSIGLLVSVRYFLK